MDYDCLYKVVLVGDMSVGKTSLVKRFKDDVFLEDYRCTLGVDFTVQTLDIEGKKIKVISLFDDDLTCI